MTAQLIEGSLRDYDWGRPDGLTPWSGAATGGPQAELWFGAHPGAPSAVVGTDASLSQVWGGYDVPLLAKILAAGSPLSLQVHPDAATAARWWQDPTARELLADRSEKTEMLVAIEPFTVLAGWRDAASALQIMTAVGAPEPVLAALREGDHATAVRSLLTDHPVVADASAWIDAVAATGLDEVAVAAITAVVARFGADPGVAVAALLASDLLAPGDAVYVPAGVPHAYVSGLGFEIMNSSDNVLRMGLTGKQMSIDHALAAIREDRSQEVIRHPADGVYAPAGAPFQVRWLLAGAAELPAGGYRLVVALRGEVAVETGGQSFVVAQGQALALPDGAASARISAPGHAVLVSATRATG